MSVDMDGSTSSGTPLCFTQQYEAALAADICLSSWCPTMDLCAVVSCDGQLHVHRMNWQVLWVTCPDTVVTAVCWSPDGKILATGQKDGCICMYDVESGDVKSRYREHFAQIVSLTWTEAGCLENKAMLAYMGSFARYKRLFAPTSDVLPQHSSTGPTDPYDMTTDSLDGTSWPAEASSIDVLVAGDSQGRISLWMCGEVQLADVGTNAGPNDMRLTLRTVSTVKVLHACAE